jgi:HK97 family phage portal protein
MHHDAPNPYMSSFIFRETMQAHVLTWGNAYAEKRRNGTGQVIEMYLLRPDRMAKLIDTTTNRLFYRYTLPSGEQRDVAYDDIFHLVGLGFDGLVGYPVLSYMAREVLGIAIAQQEYVGRYYANDARPGVYLKSPKVLSDDAAKRLKARWDEAHAGFTNAHRTAVLEDGVDIATIGASPVDQQLLESRKWSANEIAGLFRLAPWKIGIYDRATWANIEDGNIDHWQSALRAWFVRWEQQLNLQVVGLDTGHFAEHLIDGILRGNSASRAQFYWTLRQAGAITADEIRDRENMNRRGGAADDLFAPLNMAPLNVPPSSQQESRS